MAEQISVEALTALKNKVDELNDKLQNIKGKQETYKKLCADVLKKYGVKNGKELRELYDESKTNLEQVRVKAREYLDHHNEKLRVFEEKGII